MPALKPNPIHEWLNRAASEFKTPDEMRAATAKVACENTRKLLFNHAGKWGASIIRRETDRHWSAPDKKA